MKCWFQKERVDSLVENATEVPGVEQRFIALDRWNSGNIYSYII